MRSCSPHIGVDPIGRWLAMVVGLLGYLGLKYTSMAEAKRRIQGYLSKTSTASDVAGLVTEQPLPRWATTTPPGC